MGETPEKPYFMRKNIVTYNSSSHEFSWTNVWSSPRQSPIVESGVTFWSKAGLFIKKEGILYHKCFYKREGPADRSAGQSMKKYILFQACCPVTLYRIVEKCVERLCMMWKKCEIILATWGYIKLKHVCTDAVTADMRCGWFWKNFRQRKIAQMNDKLITISSPKQLQEWCDWYKI